MTTEQYWNPDLLSTLIKSRITFRCASRWRFYFKQKGDIFFLIHILYVLPQIDLIDARPDDHLFTSMLQVILLLLIDCLPKHALESHSPMHECRI